MVLTEVLFLHYLRLKSLLCHLSGIPISFAKPCMENTFIRVFTNSKKCQAIVGVSHLLYLTKVLKPLLSLWILNPR